MNGWIALALAACTLAVQIYVLLTIRWITRVNDQIAAHDRAAAAARLRAREDLAIDASEYFKGASTADDSEGAWGQR